MLFRSLVAAAVLLMATLTACDHEVDIKPPSASKDSTGQHAEEAQQALTALVKAVSSGSRTAAQGAAAKGSEDLLGSVYDNAAALHVDDFSLRYIDEGTPLNDQEQAEAGPSAWRGTVQLTYRYAGFDTAPARIETAATFAPKGAGVGIASFGGDQERTPVWLAERLSVVRTPRTLLAVAASTAGRYPGLVSTAVRQVSRVLTGWKGKLAVEVPASEDQLDAELKAQPGEYDNIAAVTTTADGSLAPDAPVRVFVNPDVFGRLKQRGAQVVMSHETTHVATGAPFATMPTWLLEGFADFVALDHAGIPVTLAAGQILPRIRKDGLPDGLPTAQELDPTANGLGATYEEAWLACRFLAQEYGDDAMVRFYRTVNNGTPTAQAFRTVLHTTQKEFVARWRHDLAGLAGVAG